MVWMIPEKQAEERILEKHQFLKGNYIILC